MVQKLVLLIMTCLILGCGGNQTGRLNAAVSKEVQLEQIQDRLKDIAFFTYEYELGNYPNEEDQIARFSIRYIMGQSAQLIQDKRIKLDDVNNVAQEFFAQSIAQPKSVGRFKYSEGFYSIVPYAKEEETRFVVDRIDTEGVNLYKVTSSIYNVPSRFNKNSSDKIFDSMMTILVKNENGLRFVVLANKLIPAGRVVVQTKTPQKLIESARAILFAYKPEWQMQEAKGKHILKLKSGLDVSSTFVIDSKVEDNNRTVQCHVYNIVDYPDGMGHTATVGWYRVDVESGEIYDTILNKRVQ